MDGPVIVGVDARKRSEDALALAGLLATALGSRLVLAHVVTPTPPGWGGVEFELALKREARELLDRVASRAGVSEVDRQVLEWPSTSWALHKLSRDLDASLVVVGSSHRGTVGRLLLGSVGHGLITGAPCGVAVAPAGFRHRAPGALRQIGVAYDGRPEADEALDLGVRLAGTTGAELRLWLAVAPTEVEGPAPERQAELTHYMHHWAQKRLQRGLARVPDGICASSQLLEGDAVHAIAAAAAALPRPADLVVCGSRGFGPLRSAMAGSVSRRLMDEARCPVVLVPRPVLEAADS